MCGTRFWCLGVGNIKGCVLLSFHPKGRHILASNHQIANGLSVQELKGTCKLRHNGKRLVFLEFIFKLKVFIEGFVYTRHFQTNC